MRGVEDGVGAVVGGALRRLVSRALSWASISLA